MQPELDGETRGARRNSPGDEMPFEPDATHAAIATAIARRERILARLRQVLVRQLKHRRDADELDPDAPLFGSGFGLDSLDAVEVVVCLEADYGARASEHELLRGSMRSLNVLCDFVLSHGDPARVGV